MNTYLRDKMLQKLETLSDERGYQVLDYVDFLESKYAERAAVAPGAVAGNHSRASLMQWRSDSELAE